VGTEEVGFGNLVAGNVDAGVELSGAGARGNLLVGNVIGAFGSQYPTNGTYGVLLKDGASRNKIGKVGEQNTISFNGADGIAVLGDNSRRNSIRGNNMRNNGGLGIDLADDGVSANDASDGDDGPNKGQNYPVLKSFNDVSRTVKGKMVGAPNTEYSIDVYVNEICDVTGHGEGIFVDSFKVTTRNDGKIKFKAVVESEFPFNLVTMTATDPRGNTSEFSNCKS
jgi:titin